MELLRGYDTRVGYTRYDKKVLFTRSIEVCSHILYIHQAFKWIGRSTLLIKLHYRTRLPIYHIDYCLYYHYVRFTEQTRKFTALINTWNLRTINTLIGCKGEQHDHIWIACVFTTRIKYIPLYLLCPFLIL